MSPPVITESGYTKFNLSYPQVMANGTVTEVDEVSCFSPLPPRFT